MLLDLHVSNQMLIIKYPLEATLLSHVIYLHAFTYFILSETLFMFKTCQESCLEMLKHLHLRGSVECN